MFKSIFKHFRNEGEIRKIDTEFYPDPVSSRSKDDFPARARGLLFNEIEKCNGCGLCRDVCPTKCIDVASVMNERNNRPWVTKFEIDYSNCIFCGKCVEVCEPESLSQTKEIQPAVVDLKSLRTDFGRGDL
jgi:formate hydrogenlyase subunit 6/NADH:ubiquinone oxidoreductase subunit I